LNDFCPLGNCAFGILIFLKKIENKKKERKEKNMMMIYFGSQSLKIEI